VPLYFHLACCAPVLNYFSSGAERFFEDAIMVDLSEDLRDADRCSFGGQRDLSLP
jgi:hypothetical protein